MKNSRVSLQSLHWVFGTCYPPIRSLIEALIPLQVLITCTFLLTYLVSIHSTDTHQAPDRQEQDPAVYSF